MTHLQATLDIKGGTCLPSSIGSGVTTEQDCGELTSPTSWNVGTCSDGVAPTRAACDTAGGVWSVPVTTETFKYGVNHAFQAVSTNCDMVATPYLNSLCSQCSQTCMVHRSMYMQAGFAVASSILIVTYLMALCAAGYNERLLEAEEKTWRMLTRAKRCQCAVVVLSVVAVVLILRAHTDITRACGLVQPVRHLWILYTPMLLAVCLPTTVYAHHPCFSWTLTTLILWLTQSNPSALEITGLASADGDMYDPAGDDDPTTAGSCSATVPLIVALSSSAGLTLANVFNYTAIIRVNPILVWIAHRKLS
eukprot:COSAG02_NODE_709_length_18217_cov_13.019704_7_plen_307_part_00